MAKASDNEFPSVLVKEGTAPANPAAGDQRVYIDSADHKFKRVNSSGSVTTIEGGTAITVSENFLTSNTNMTNANTFYDGPSLSLAAGTYLLDAIVTLDNATAGWCNAKIWDGSTLMSASPAEYNSKAGGAVALSVIGYVVLGGTTTVKVSAAQQQASGHILATDPQGNGTTNKASYLRTTKIA